MTKDTPKEPNENYVILPKDDSEIIGQTGLDLEHLFTVFREGNEPLESVVKGERRRSNEFAEKKARAMKLATLLTGLTPQQHKFVTHYVAKDWDSLSEVMIRCGSTAKGDALRQIAYQYLQRKDIKEAIALMTLRKLEAEGIDRYEVIGMLRETRDSAMADGKYKEATEAAQLLGNAIGMFSNTKGATKDLSKLEASQLKDINQVARQAGIGDPKPTNDLAFKPDSFANEVVNEELTNALKLAGLKLN